MGILKGEKSKALLLAFLVFALILGAIRATLSARLADMETEKTGQQPWAQPAEVAYHYPVPISSDEWPFDYERAGTLIKTLPHDPEQGLPLNAHTADILQRAAATLPDELDEAAIARVGFLSSQGLPGKTGAQVSETFTGIIRYLQARRALESSAPKRKDLAAAQAQLDSTIALQNHYLGEDTAQRLFAQRRMVRQHLLQRRQLLENPDLSPQQHRQALDDMSQHFKLMQVMGIKTMEEAP